MEKLKIKGMSSEEYPGGRIDSFKIDLPEESPHHSHIIPLFLDFGLSNKEASEKLDIILQEIDYLFIYISSKIKAHIIMEKDSFSIKFDTSLSRDEINKRMEKYFEFPED